MATPIAHKGVVAGAKVQALTLLDILLTPKIVADAWDYFRNVQTKDTKYTPFITAADKPAILLNADRHGEVPAPHAAVLLRSVEVRHVPRPARHQVSRR